MRRFLRIVGVVLGLLVATVVAVVVAGLLYLRTDAGNRQLLAFLLPRIQPDHGQIVVGAFHSDLANGAVIEGVEVRDAEGRALVHLDRAEVSWRLGGLPGRKLIFPEARLTGLAVVLADETTCFDLAGLWDPSPEPSAPWSGIGVDLALDRLQIDDARVAMCLGEQRLRADGVSGTVALHIDGPVVTWSDLDLTGQVALDTREGAARATGSGSWNGREVVLGSTALTFGPNALTVAGRIGLEGPGALDLTVHQAVIDPASLGIDGIKGVSMLNGRIGGTFGDPTGDLWVRTPGGALTVVGAFHDGDRPTWEARVETASLQLDEVLADLDPTEVHGTFQVSGTGVVWPDVEAHATFAGGSSGVYGEGPFTLMADADLRDGTVLLGSVRLDGPAGRVALSGVVDPDAGTWSGDVADSRVDLRTLARFGVDDLSGTARFSGHTEGSWKEPLHVEVDGRIVVDALGWTQDLAVASAAGRVNLTIDGTRPSGNVDLTLGGVEAWGYTAEEGVARIVINGDRYDVAASLTDPDHEVVGFEGTVDLGRRELAANRLHVELVAGSAWDNLGPVAARWTDDGVDDLLLHVRSGAARVSLDGDFHLRGTHDLRVAVAELSLASLAPMVPALSGYEGVVTVDGTVTGASTDPSFEATARVSGLVVPKVLHGLGLTVTLEGGDHEVRFDAEARAAGDLSLTADGAFLFDAPKGIPVASLDDPLRLRVWMPPTDVADWSAVLDTETALPVARASAELTVEGRLVNPDADLVASIQLPTAGRERVEVDVDAHLVDGVMEVRSVGRQRFARRVEVTGGWQVDVPELARMAGLDLGPDRTPGEGALTELSVDVVPMQLPVDALRAFIDLPSSLQGTVVGGLHIAGDLHRPELAGGLMLIGGRLGDISLSPALVSLTPGEGGYDADIEIGFGEGGHLRASGRVPFDGSDRDIAAILARPGLDIRLDGSAVPVAVVGAFVPGLVEAGGVMAVTGSLTGTLGEAAPEVVLSMKDGAFTLLTTNIRYERLTFTAHLDREQVTVEDFGVVTRSIGRPLERGRRVDENTLPAISGRARIALENWEPAATEASLRFDKAWIADLPAYVLRFSGTASATGTWPVLAVKGKVDVDEGKLVLGESFFSGDGSLVLDDDIHVLRPGLERAAVVEEGPGFTYSLDLQAALNRNVDVDVTMPTEDYGGALTRGLSEIRLAVTLADVDGLTVRKRGDDFAVIGQVEPARGKATVLGQDFDITDGTIAFTGMDARNPLLDITAVYPSSYGLITARIQGSAETPEVTLSIDEPTLSVDDAVAILVMGAPLSMMSGADGTNALLSLALRSLATAQVAELGQLTQFDVFEVDAEGASVGKRLGSRVMLTVGVDYDSAETMAVKAAIEVQLPQRWFFELETSSDGTTRAAAYRRWRF